MSDLFQQLQDYSSDSNEDDNSDHADTKNSQLKNETNGHSKSQSEPIIVQKQNSGKAQQPLKIDAKTKN